MKLNDKVYEIITIVMLLLSITLLVIGFVVPPTGVIDGSVLSAVGEIGLFTMIFNIPYYIKKLSSVHFEKGDMKVDINK